MSCPDCFRGSVHDHKGQAKGQESELHGRKVYIAAPTSSSSNSTIVFFTDAFGLGLINNKILADRYARESGHRVVVPDVMPAPPPPPELMGKMEDLLQPDKPTAWYDVLGWLKKAYLIFYIASKMVPFMIKAAPNKPASWNACLSFARAVKQDLPSGGKLGVIGHCWGGYPATNLCVEPAVEGASERLVDASFVAHPSGLKLPDHVIAAVTKFKVPYSAAFATNDMVMPVKDQEGTIAALNKQCGPGKGENGFNYEVRMYEGAYHGFAVRTKPGDEVGEKAEEEAAQQAVEWFKKWL